MKIILILLAFFTPALAWSAMGPSFFKLKKIITPSLTKRTSFAPTSGRLLPPPRAEGRLMLPSYMRGGVVPLKDKLGYVGYMGMKWRREQGGLKLNTLLVGQHTLEIFNHFWEQLQKDYGQAQLSEKYAVAVPFIQAYAQLVSDPFAHLNYHRSLGQLEQKILREFQKEFQGSPLEVQLINLLDHKRATPSAHLLGALKAAYEKVLREREEHFGLRAHEISQLLSSEEFYQLLREGLIPIEVPTSKVALDSHGAQSHRLQIHVLMDVFEQLFEGDEAQKKELFLQVYAFFADRALANYFREEFSFRRRTAKDCRGSLEQRVLSPYMVGPWSLIFDREHLLSPQAADYVMMMASSQDHPLLKLLFPLTEARYLVFHDLIFGAGGRQSMDHYIPLLGEVQ